MAATLEFRLTTGGLGGAATGTAVSATALNNIYDDVDATEASAGDTEYRAIDVYNTGDATATSVEIYMSSATTSTDTQLDMGVESTHLNVTTSTANESTAPAAVTFANRTSGASLAIDSIPAAEYARVWLRRVVSASATNTSNDTGTIEVGYA